MAMILRGHSTHHILPAGEARRYTATGLLANGVSARRRCIGTGTFRSLLRRWERRPVLRLVALGQLLQLPGRLSERVAVYFRPEGRSWLTRQIMRVYHVQTEAGIFVFSSRRFDPSGELDISGDHHSLAGWSSVLSRTPGQPDIVSKSPSLMRTAASPLNPL